MIDRLGREMGAAWRSGVGIKLPGQSRLTSQSFAGDGTLSISCLETQGRSMVIVHRIKSQT